MKGIKMMRNKKLMYIFFIAILTTFLLYISDQVLSLNYMTKAGMKLILFSVFPIIYFIQTGENVLKESLLNIRKNKVNIPRMKLSFFLGIFVFCAIIGAYVILQQYIDNDQLIIEFEKKYKINRNNIIYYSLYITFINSLLEEFFFRGFLFLNIKRLGYRKTAYIISSIIFAIYHIANFQNWFLIGVFIIAIAGLFIGGCIFNFLDEEQETFLNSWFVHICADLGIVLIGLRIFGIITFI